jgi:ubiquinone biosynthesis monooxygenase Coq7
MALKRRGLLEQLIIEVDHALHVVGALDPAARPTPAPHAATSEGLAREDQACSARLMRVNHAGEVAAQALYRGQALMARDANLRRDLHQAADEEHDHLVWCRQRVAELGGRVSLLSPLWYIGSFAIGAAAGVAGDAISNGFLRETERQVTEHLSGHLGRLPAADRASREIVEVMRRDESSHGEAAASRGATPLPAPVRVAMRLAAGVMTRVSHWI